MIAALNGAHKVVITDYPEDKLLNGIRENVVYNLPVLHSEDRVIVLV